MTASDMHMDSGRCMSEAVIRSYFSHITEWRGKRRPSNVEEWPKAVGKGFHTKEINPWCHAKFDANDIRFVLWWQGKSPTNVSHLISYADKYNRMHITSSLDLSSKIKDATHFPIIGSSWRDCISATWSKQQRRWFAFSTSKLQNDLNETLKPSSHRLHTNP